MKNIKTIIYFSLLLINVNKIFAQPYTIEWQKCFGGSGQDYSYSIVQDIKNEYAVVGRIDDTSLCSMHGAPDIWFLKLDSSGNQTFSNCFGGSLYETVTDIQYLSIDSSHIICGGSSSSDFDVPNNHGGVDCWVFKTDYSGSILWSKCYGGSYDDGSGEIIQTKDGGFIIAGQTTSNDGDVSGLHGLSDAWIIKIDSNGTLMWQKCYGGSNNDWANSIIQTYDNGYIFACLSYSNDGDVTNNKGLNDAWIVKIDSIGNIQWQKTYGGSNYDLATSIIQTSDSCYVFSAITNSANGDVTHFYGSEDIWVVKINSTGSIIWQNSYGGTNSDVGYKIMKTFDSSFIIGGNSHSNDGDVTNHHGLVSVSDYWVLKIDSLGNLINEESFGGSDDDQFTSIRQTSDSGLILTGYVLSSNGDVTGHIGGEDFWVLKLSNQINNNIEDIPNKLIDLSAQIQIDRLTVRFKSSKEQSIQFNLYNLEGKLIYYLKDKAAEGINYKQLNTGNLSHGFYFLAVSGQGISERVKVVY